MEVNSENSKLWSWCSVYMDSATCVGFESCDKEMNELKWILNVLEQGHVSKFNDIVKKLGCM